MPDWNSSVGYDTTLHKLHHTSKVCRPRAWRVETRKSHCDKSSKIKYADYENFREDVNCKDDTKSGSNDAKFG